MLSLRIHTRPTVFPLILAPAAAGCESAPGGHAPSGTEVQGTRIRDSAEVVIVDNARPADDSRLGWRVSPDPVISIGTVEGGDDFQLHWVDDALRLPDGRIVVANGGSHQLLVFDGAGNYLTAWGRRGRGPGEFSGSRGTNGLGPPQLFWMERWPGDSLAVCHAGSPAGARRFVSVWDTTGNFGRRLNLARDGRVPDCMDVLPGRGVLTLHWTPVPALEQVKGLSRQADLEFFVVAGDGYPRGSLGLHPGAENFWHWEDHRTDGTAFFIPEPPFQRSLVWSAWGQLVVLAPTDHYELRAYRHDGSVARIVRRENDVRSPVQADLDSYLAVLRRYAERWPPDGARLFRAALDALTLPGSFPAFSAIEVDLLDHLWVREYNLPGDEDRALWTVFDPVGVALGFVETPPGLVIYEIGENYILGKVEDGLGVEYVELWGLDRAG